MGKISTILLAIDGDYDDQALLAEVESIVSDSHSRVTLFSVTEPAVGSADRNVAVSNLRKWERKVRSIQVDSLSAALSKRNIQVTTKHVAGKAYLEIIRETLASDYDLVMKPARGEVGVKRFLIGETDIQLLSLCPRPVWIFKPTKNRTVKRIAVAVDVQPDDSERTALAEDVLKSGERIAALASAELHVVHIWSLYRETSLRSRSGLSDTVDKLAWSKERLHRRWLDEALRNVGLDNDKLYTHVRKGDAERLIPRVVDELTIDLLIMGTVGRTGIPGFFIGNTADSVLRKVSCSVFAVKPEKFSTPVEPATKK